MSMRTTFSLNHAKKKAGYVFGPLLLIVTLLFPLCFLLWYINVSLEGSLERFYAQMQNLLSLWTTCRPCLFGTLSSWTIFLLFMAVALTLFKMIPGRKSSHQSIMSFKMNGLFVMLIMLLLYSSLSFGLKLFSPTILYDEFGALLGSLNLFALCFWPLSYMRTKRTHFSLFTVCRCAMIGWALLLLSFAAKQQATTGLSNALGLCVLLQWIFIAKFFWWEMGYLSAVEITYDSQGFFLYWGAIVWIPAIYTSPALYLVHHPRHLSPSLLLLFFIGGAASIFVNFLVDKQRHYVRSRNGDCLIWRKKPELIFANYQTEWGEERQNVLLASGWWGLSRHFHYIPEFLGAFFWSAPALFAHFLPYFYLFFLSLLLIDRAYRHEKRCAMKYGKDWQKYCERVPFRIIPFIY